MAKKKKLVEQVEVEPVVNEVVEEQVESKVKTGVVFDCLFLNVREQPNINAGIICTVRAGEVVEINDEQSTSVFYSIRTANGVSGFCMKKFIKIP